MILESKNMQLRIAKATCRKHIQRIYKDSPHRWDTLQFDEIHMQLISERGDFIPPWETINTRPDGTLAHWGLTENMLDLQLAWLGYPVMRIHGEFWLWDGNDLIQWVEDENEYKLSNVHRPFIWLPEDMACYIYWSIQHA